jgi:Bacterial PH domain
MASTAPTFDKQDQLDRVTEGLLAGETVTGVFDCIGAGTGFVGLTDRRVILQDNSFVGKKVALTSVPYSRVQAVSFVTNRSMLGKFVSTGEVSILVGGKQHECEFRGHERAKSVHDTILFHMLRSQAA